MWIVAKINPNQISIFKDSIVNNSSEMTEFYFPKIIFKSNKKLRTKIFFEIIFFVLINILIIKKLDRLNI